MLEVAMSLLFEPYSSTSCAISDVSVARDAADYCNLRRTPLCRRVVHRLNR